MIDAFLLGQKHGLKLKPTPKMITDYAHNEGLAMGEEDRLSESLRFDEMVSEGRSDEAMKILEGIKEKNPALAKQILTPYYEEAYKSLNSSVEELKIFEANGINTDEYYKKLFNSAM